MAKVSQMSSGSANNLVSNTTRYISLALTGWQDVPSANEIAVQITQRTAGIFSSLYVRVAANTLDGSGTFRTRKNSTDANLTVTVGTAATGTFEDTTNSDTVSVGENWNYSYVAGGTTGVMTVRDTGVNFAATSNTVARYANIGNVSWTQAVTYFYALSGNSPITNFTEARAQTNCVTAITLRNLFLYVLTNSITANSTFRTRVATANGAQSITVGSTATGIFEDTVNSDSVTTNQLVGFQAVMGSAAGTVMSPRTMSVESSSTNSIYYAISDDSNGAAVSTTPNICNFNGKGITDVTETVYQRQSRIGANISNTGVNVSANTANGISTFTFRINGADTTLSASIGAAATGNIEDTTHSVAVVSSDLINYVCTRGGTGTCTIRSTWSKVTNTEAPTGGTTHFLQLLGVGT